MNRLITKVVRTDVVRSFTLDEYIVITQCAKLQVSEYQVGVTKLDVPPHHLNLVKFPKLGLLSIWSPMTDASYPLAPIRNYQNTTQVPCSGSCG